MYYIYKIENLVNGKKYIGLTNNIERRRKRHFSDLKRNCHGNHFLQKEFNKYGEENFSFKIEFEGDIDYLQISQKEKEYITLYDSYHNGYNQNEGGNFGPSNGGSNFTKEDIFNILSAIEFMNRPGKILSELFDTTRTTISRIKKGENHCEYREEYLKFPIEKRKEIFDKFCKEKDLLSLKKESMSMKTRRKLLKEQVYFILAATEKGISNVTRLAGKFGVNRETINKIIHSKTYKDYYTSYQELSEKDKEKIISDFIQ